MQFELRFSTEDFLTGDYIRGVGTDDVEIIKEKMETEDLLLSLIDNDQGAQNDRGFVMYLNLEEAEKICEFNQSHYINIEIEKNEGKLSKKYLERVIGVSYSALDKAIYRVRIYVRINKQAVFKKWLDADCPKILHLENRETEDEKFDSDDIIFVTTDD